MSHERRKRTGILFLIGAVLVPLAIVSTAWACGRLTTLRLSAESAKTGQEITAFGGNYNTQPTSSDVTIRLGGRNGRVLWQGRPNQTGAISPAFIVPRLKAGYYTIVATQSLANGTPAPGTPGRDVLRIGRVKSTSSKSSAAPWAAPAPPADNAGPPGGAAVGGERSVSVPAPVVVGGGVLFLVLSGTGVMVLRSTRRTWAA